MSSNKIKDFFINETNFEIYTIVVARYMTILMDSFFSIILMPIIYKNKKNKKYYKCKFMGVDINIGIFAENIFKFIIVLIVLSYLRSYLSKIKK